MEIRRRTFDSSGNEQKYIDQTNSHTEKNANTLGRRKFLSMGIGTIGAVIGLSYIGLFGKFMGPQSASATTKLQEVGSVGKFPVNTPTLVGYIGTGTEEGVYVVNLGSEGFIALDFHCTHLECNVIWVPAIKQFSCPCHGGLFDIKGTVLSGPPPKPLYRRIVKIEGDNVLIGGRLVCPTG